MNRTVIAPIIGRNFVTIAIRQSPRHSLSPSALPTLRRVNSDILKLSSRNFFRAYAVPARNQPDETASTPIDFELNMQIDDPAVPYDSSSYLTLHDVYSKQVSYRSSRTLLTLCIG